MFLIVNLKNAKKNKNKSFSFHPRAIFTFYPQPFSHFVHNHFRILFSAICSFFYNHLLILFTAVFSFYLVIFFFLSTAIFSFIQSYLIIQSTTIYLFYPQPFSNAILEPFSHPIHSRFSFYPKLFLILFTAFFSFFFHFVQMTSVTNKCKF